MDSRGPGGQRAAWGPPWCWWRGRCCAAAPLHGADTAWPPAARLSKYLDFPAPRANRPRPGSAQKLQSSQQPHKCAQGGVELRKARRKMLSLVFLSFFFFIGTDFPNAL